MNYVPDFGNWIWLLGTACCSGGLLYGFQLVDEDWKNCDREWLWSVWTVVLLVGSLGIWGQVQKATPILKVCWLAIAVYLIVCTVMDSVLCQVNDVLQYVGALGGVFFLWNSNPHPIIGISLILFAGMQQLLFRRFYGRADTMAFSICAMYLAGMDGEVDRYLWHMTVSFILMGIVQALHGNITKKGKLREPVPMLPYISAGFLLMVLE